MDINTLKIKCINFNTLKLLSFHLFSNLIILHLQYYQ